MSHFSDAEWKPVLVGSGVKDVVPVGRKYKPIPRQADNPSQDESVVLPHIQLPLEDRGGNSVLLVSVASRLDIWKQQYVDKAYIIEGPTNDRWIHP